MADGNFNRMPRRYTDRPRRVTSGVKLRGKDGPELSTWIGARWMRIIEESAPAESIALGLRYAADGQTRALDLDTGCVSALVQGRAYRAYRTSIETPRLTEEQWGRVVEAIAEHGAIAARLLAGDLPKNIEDVFIPLGLRLFPGAEDELKTECACEHASPWCKHACCAALIVAERLEDDPFLIFELRGLSPVDLRDRLRQRRTAAAAPLGAAPAYAPRPATATDDLTPPLEACVDEFWKAGESLSRIETSLAPPKVSHALLRRLGPSPFEHARFPLVGLLATCYDSMSRAALSGGESEEAAQRADVE